MYIIEGTPSAKSKPKLIDGVLKEENFYLGSKNGVHVFMSDSAAKLLSDPTLKTLVADGTFGTAPRGSVQTVRIKAL